MKKLNVNLNESPYNIYIGKNILQEFGKILKKTFTTDNIFFVIDSNAYKFHKNKIDSLLGEFSTKGNILKITPTEKIKSLDTIQQIYKRLLKNKFSRKSNIVALGGGIVGDMVGFAAATFMRGINYIQIPTTLLSMVDSSVGGKTAVNFGDTKNVIGSFYQPKFVLCDTDFLSSLKHEELVCGLGEIVKYAFLTDVSFYKYIFKNYDKILNCDEKVLAKIIYESLHFKSSVVLQDEKENSLRKVLNLGHTFGHAFEVEQNHRIKHGQAVIAGIIAALFASKRTGLLEEKLFDKFISELAIFKQDIKLKNPDLNKILSIMLRDKKNDSGKINFVLLKDIGNICLDINLERKLIKETLTQTFNYLK